MEKKQNKHRKTPEKPIHRLRESIRRRLGSDAIKEVLPTPITDEDIYSGMIDYKKAKARALERDRMRKSELLEEESNSDSRANF